MNGVALFKRGGILIINIQGLNGLYHNGNPFSMESWSSYSNPQHSAFLAVEAASGMTAAHCMKNVALNGGS